MATDDHKPRFTLSRWSQRKLAAARSPEQPVAPKAANVAAPALAPTAPGAAAAESAAAAAPALPPIESLTFESDFTAFLGPRVDEALRRRALRTLFRDPRFNAMDGLDVYIDDYTQFETLTPEMVKQLAHAKYIFAPPPTRVNEQGFVEDIPEQPLPSEAGQEVPVAIEARVPNTLPMENRAAAIDANPVANPVANAQTPALGTPPTADGNAEAAGDNAAPATAPSR